MLFCGGQPIALAREGVLCARRVLVRAGVGRSVVERKGWFVPAREAPFRLCPLVERPACSRQLLRPYRRLLNAARHAAARRRAWSRRLVPSETVSD